MNKYRTLQKLKNSTDEYELLEPHVSITTEIENLASNRHALYFKLANGTQIFLETSRRYAEGNSITHLDFAYRTTQDELMVRSAKVGDGVHRRAHDKSWVTSPYGPDTLAILETMGYKLKTDASFENSLGGYMASKYPTHMPVQVSHPHVPKTSKDAHSRKKQTSRGNNTPSATGPVKEKSDKRIPLKPNSRSMSKDRSPKDQAVDLKNARATLRPTKKK
ncbi:hypothetical protein DSO57_1036920 [Entomophthora muscae]|uniref:Uncharacterized protein n=1 Tax=Entomophthora muscae TaxID=34485 RepID=A0ACC2S116_9FUNG|nr:hypothetical protein DSO57_1036920 [Entomophthora muscae]